MAMEVIGYQDSRWGWYVFDPPFRTAAEGQGRRQLLMEPGSGRGRRPGTQPGAQA